jgi:imidazolonepropionase-like amidohydrolase
MTEAVGSTVEDTFVLREVQILDESGGFGPATDVAVEGGWIAAIGEGVGDRDARSIDAGGLWLMPGVFDCHDHVTFSSLEPMELLETPVTQWTLEAARNARRTLECGVTFVRDAAGADQGLKTAIERGYAAGPELQISVVALSQTGGHMDGFLTGPGMEISGDYVLPDFPGRPPFLVDGAEAMRRVVREVLRAGADWIKLCTTGGILSPHDDPMRAEFTREEIQIAVEEAERRGKGVMVHAFGGEGLDLAVEAGVRSVEHGVFLTEEQAKTMAASDCWLVPTLSITHAMLGWADAGLLPPYSTRKVEVLREVVGQAVSMARDAGVRIALGTDHVSRDQHGTNLREICLLHEAGLSPEEALLSATRSGAELCGVADRLGRIATGCRFDAIVLDRDPSDLSVFAGADRPTAVFKAGRPARPSERLGFPCLPE